MQGIQALEEKLSYQCAVCSQPCSNDRVCTTCGRPLHHFCSHDVCRLLGLIDIHGEPVNDFGEQSFCSSNCYEHISSNISSTSYVQQLNSSALAGYRRLSVFDDLSQSSSFPPNSETPNIHFGRFEQNSHETQRGGSSTFRSVDPNCSEQGEGTNEKQQVFALATCSITQQRKARKQTATKPASSLPSKRKAASVSGRGQEGDKPPPKRIDKATKLQNELILRLQQSSKRYVNANVAFSPARELWMKSEHYRDVGELFLVGNVVQFKVKKSDSTNQLEFPIALYEIRWTNTAFQTAKHVHQLTEEQVLRGVTNYARIQSESGQFGESWDALCSMIPKYTRFGDVPALTDEFEEWRGEMDGRFVVYHGRDEFSLPRNPREVELVKSMTFTSTEQLPKPNNLFIQRDGGVKTIINEEFRSRFEASACSSFFSYLPLSFWKQVVIESNKYAAANPKAPKDTPIILDEMMKFLGIMWFMSVVDKGEMKNYWGYQIEDMIFRRTGSSNLDNVMSFKRFKFIRQNLCFRFGVTRDELKDDPAAKIRPLINLFKSRCARFVHLGRDVAVDEASIACRSKFARHIILYNPTKPGGKYHFRLYACCCSSSWLMVDFKLACSSNLSTRLDGVLPESSVRELDHAIEDSSDIRKHVLEVTHKIQGSRRIVNTDNFYTSCLLLDSLRTLGLFGRGTVRSNSKHFPHFVILQPGDQVKRGDFKQGVCINRQIIAASWCDGSIVNVVSNADSSNITTVYRQIDKKKTPFTSPECIAEYNSGMQAVDRLDQMRSRFSLADGHSFKMWHKKLAMAILDIVRCNAYITRSLAGVAEMRETFDDNGNVLASDSETRDEHRIFVATLASELMHGSWKELLKDDSGMIYSMGDSEAISGSSTHKSNQPVPTSLPGIPACVPRISKNTTLKRAARGCVVCRLEKRYETQQTLYCETHKVCLCTKSYCKNNITPWACPQEEWTCWQKFHDFYFPRGTFTSKGNLRRGSAIAKAAKST